MADTMLHEELTMGAKFLGSADYYQQNIPKDIINNLNPKFELRPYQLEAFGRFQYYMESYMESYSDRPKDCPTQLLYHMATGSGKTLIMAGLMLYLYQQGYRNFLFFVNSNNIINKTRDNFLNAVSSKYLFNETVQLGQEQIAIKEVTNFQAVNSDAINIIFTTIQGLHSDFTMPRENRISFYDFASDKTVLISDEAHHINAETKRANQLGQLELSELNSWESTVKQIVTANPKNILLEFTATIDLNNEDIKNKYQDKIIFDYPLKNFRNDGYSKEVKILQADIPMMDRCLQAMLMSQYRRKLFEKNGVLIKPVILFKAKTIEGSKDFFIEFMDKIKDLTAKDLQIIKNNPKSDTVLQQLFVYFADNNITLTNLALELQQDFSADKCLAINSKDDSERKQIAVNSLEDSNNEYRAIFAVDKLNEGWDVLNLFDIVRLYDTRTVTKGKGGKSTVAEAQLIGRGARYCPFQINEEQEQYQRKYDKDLTNPLRLCEELYYHSAYNSRYIQELNMALQEIGIKAKTSRELTLQLKDKFKEQAFYKAGYLFKNERVKNNREAVTGLNSSFVDTRHKISLLTGQSQSSTVFDDEKFQHQVNGSLQDYHLSDFGKTVIGKALRQYPDYKFSNLKRFYPHLKSVDEFIYADSYLGNIKLELAGQAELIKNLSQDDKLYCATKLLDKLRQEMQADDVVYQGTTEFKPYMIKEEFKAYKKLNISNDGTTDKELGIAQKETTNHDLRLDLAGKDWFAYNENYGTSEEKYFVKYFDKMIDKLRKEYKQIYLLRNERFFKLYNFDDGKAFEPDFVLFLLKNNQQPALHYQIFIEPKGSHLLKQDEWKQNFLLQLQTTHKVEQLWQNKKYIVWGLPFYNEENTKLEFEESFNSLIDS